MDYDVWINKALISIGVLERESTFLLKDLFSGIEWNKLRTGEKSHLGRLFKKAVENNKIPTIIVVESPKGTSTTYKKV